MPRSSPSRWRSLTESTDVVRLEAALEELDGPRPSSRRRPVVVVTFDDGTDDFVDVALPILERHRIPVTMYLATAFIDDGSAFPDGGRPASWSALTDACATGLVDIGSHTHRHRLLDRLPSVEVADELDRSIDLIGDRLGRTAVDFAYPKAVFGSPEADGAVRQRFRSAALAGTRPTCTAAPTCIASRDRRSRSATRCRTSVARSRAACDSRTRCDGRRIACATRECVRERFASDGRARDHDRHQPRALVGDPAGGVRAGRVRCDRRLGSRSLRRRARASGCTPRAARARHALDGSDQGRRRVRRAGRDLPPAPPGDRAHAQPEARRLRADRGSGGVGSGDREHGARAVRAP